MSGQGAGRGIIIRSVLATLAVAVLLAGLVTALLIKTSQVIRPDCIVGVRDQDCGTITDYHMGLRLLIVGLAVALVCGILLVRRSVKSPAESV